MLALEAIALSVLDIGDSCQGPQCGQLDTAIRGLRGSHQDSGSVLHSLVS